MQLKVDLYYIDFINKSSLFNKLALIFSFLFYIGTFY